MLAKKKMIGGAGGELEAAAEAAQRRLARGAQVLLRCLSLFPMAATLLPDRYRARHSAASLKNLQM